MFKRLADRPEKYRAFAIGLVCLISLITSWGNSSVLAGILIAGIVICSLIGISDWKEHKSKKIFNC